ncbi:MAG: HAD family hydrolase [Lachnospiraceae bacterium]
MKYSWIFFDLDGTLAQSGQGIMNSVKYALRKMGKPELPEETLRRFIGPPLSDSFVRFCGCTPEEAKRGISLYREYYSAGGLFEGELYPGVEDMLRTLKEAGFRLAIATSKPEIFSVQVVEHFHLTPYFEAVCGATVDETREKKSAVISYALWTLGITQEQKASVLMVGDREHDILGAKENGLDCMGVLYGYGSREELSEAGADYIVETASEAAEKICML